MEEISLQIGDKLFLVSKEILCKYSDYFRAMFSGNYAENKQKIISIDILDPNIMNIILEYMKTGLIDLSEHSLNTIGDIAITANFLQITELMKPIQYTLDTQICHSNWMEIMAIAEICSYSKLEQYCAAFGLFSFKSMKPQWIPTIHKLIWYLSHPYLDTQCELEVFKFGLNWINNTEIGADALLVILACLDIKKITTEDLQAIQKYVKDFEYNLAFKVVEFLYDMCNSGLEITESVLNKQKCDLCQKFTEQVWSETFNIVKASKTRCLKYTPLVPIWIERDTFQESLPQCLYTYNDGKGFEQWLEVAEKNLWGWSVASWGLTKLVIVCGEYGRDMGLFMQDVKVYDIMKNEWCIHRADLPTRRHAGVTVVGDMLYIAGGVDSFSSLRDTVIVYDLKRRLYREIAKLPDDATTNPAICSHENKLYAVGRGTIYCYEDSDGTGFWKNIVTTIMRMSCIRPFKEYIYCTQSYHCSLYRFRPNVDRKLQEITSLSYHPATMCNLGNQLLIFTWSLDDEPHILTVEEYRGEADEIPKILFTEPIPSVRLNDTAGSCTLVLSLPPLGVELSDYHNKYLTRNTNND